MRDTLFHLRREETTSIQTQIREMLVSAILGGQLPSGMALPSSRKMAKTLGVSRNTVILSYQGLVDDGFLTSRERSDFYVNQDILSGRATTEEHRPRPPGNPPSWQERLRIHPSRQDNIEKPLNWLSYPFPFIYGQVDLTLFPISAWRDCTRQALGRGTMEAWTSDTRGADDPMLVEQIRTRILPRRGILVSEDQILITLGAQNALYLLSSLLIGEGSTVAVEEPGYPDARNNLCLRTSLLKAIQVDGRGLPVDQRLDDCDYVFVTPSHQFPTTVTMPIDRRKALLKRASDNDFLIIENDYECETNYVGAPTPALKSLDTEERVVYVGSLSKTLFPGLRLGYLIGPPEFIAEARALRRLMLRHAPSNNQRTTALFLAQGHHDALVNRLHRAYHERWEQMGAALNKHLPGSAESPTFGGTSYWVRGPEDLDTEVLATEAIKEGILIEPGRVHFHCEEAPSNFFRLGFSSISVERIEPGIRKLAGLIHRLTQ